MITIDKLLPPGNKIIALPTAGKARLYISSGGLVQRWRHSQLYPALRISARLFRMVMRLKAALGICPMKVRYGTEWAMDSFVQGCLPTADSAVVLIGATGPTQKIIFQLWDSEQVIGYVKYTEQPAGKARLKNEYAILNALPMGIGPRPLKYGRLADGEALVISPVYGKPFSTRLSHAADLAQFIRSLHKVASYTIDKHPWINCMRQCYGDVIEKWVELLDKHNWPVVFQHGDFAPWNILRTPDKRVIAIDWEHGSINGLPYLDISYYLLQVAALIYRWSPAKAYAYVLQALRSELSPSEAACIIKLSAFEAYQKALVDGQADSAYLQRWRKAIWNA